MLTSCKHRLIIPTPDPCIAAATSECGMLRGAGLKALLGEIMGGLLKLNIEDPPEHVGVEGRPGEPR